MMALGAKALCLIETGATLGTIQAVTQLTSWMGAENLLLSIFNCFLSLKIFSGKSNKFFFKLSSVQVLLIFMFNIYWGVNVPKYICRGQKTTYKIISHMWVLELKMVLRLGGKHLYLLSHLAILPVYCSLLEQSTL